MKEKILLEEFKENPRITNENKYHVKKLNVNEDNSFEVTNELINELNIPKQNQNTMKFIFYELTGNIYDHSKFSEGCISGRLMNAQYDFRVADNGISIKNSFKNAGYEIENDSDALIKAVNGLSTKNDLGYIERGTGLNNTVNIVVNGFDGEFLLISGDVILYINSEKVISQKNPKKLSTGTIVNLRLDLTTKIDMYNYLNQIEYRL